MQNHQSVEKTSIARGSDRLKCFRRLMRIPSRLHLFLATSTRTGPDLLEDDEIYLQNECMLELRHLEPGNALSLYSVFLSTDTGAAKCLRCIWQFSLSVHQPYVIWMHTRQNNIHTRFWTVPSRGKVTIVTAVMERASPHRARSSAEIVEGSDGVLTP